MVHDLHARRNAQAHEELCSEACRVLLERDARQAGNGDPPFTHCSKGSSAHARTAHEGPLQAARCCATHPSRKSMRIEARVTRCIVGLPYIAKARTPRSRTRERREG